MKTSRIVGLVIVIVVVAISALLAFTPVGDRNNYRRVPRGDLSVWLTGELVTTPVTDWSFTDSVEVIQVQTHTSYVLPHIINTNIARIDGEVYLFSDYAPPQPGEPDMRDRFPELRFWNRNVLRDPRVRLKIGNRLFDMRAYPLTDPSLIEAPRQAFLKKYANIRAQQQRPPERRPRMHFFRTEQQVSAPRS